jgi:hypothetical protein
MGPCDIYAAASTPCVAAYSMVRVLSSKYTGPLYQVRKGGTRATYTGDEPVGTVGGTTGGTTQDIGATTDGYGDGNAQDTFCGSSTCTVSKIYDQSGKGNDLTEAPAGNYTGTAHQPDYESDATKSSITANGHKVHGLYMIAHDGYRNNTTTGMPTMTAAQGIYEIADGKRIGAACCWDFGNVRKDNIAGGTGTMAALFFGTGFWGKGVSPGPWFLGDFEAGVWATGSGASSAMNPNLPSSNMSYAFGVVKTSTASSPQYAIRVGDATTGTLMTAYDGQAPANWSLSGGIVLGIGGDNSNSSQGTFFEGAITAGRPPDATDEAVHMNAIGAGYGK